MRTENKTQVQTCEFCITTYIADDGKEFGDASTEYYDEIANKTGNFEYDRLKGYIESLSCDDLDELYWTDRSPL